VSPGDKRHDGTGPAPAGVVAFLRHTDAYWQVWLLDLETNEERQLTTSQYEKSRISWFPDGRELLVSALEGQIYRVKLSDGSEQEIPLAFRGGRDAVVSPDGTHVAVSLVLGEVLDTNEVYVIDIDGGEIRRLGRRGLFQHEPQWSPDGGYIYWHSFGRNNLDHDIWRATYDGREVEQLTSGAAYNLDVAVNAEGVQIFSSNRTGDYELWMWNPGESRAPVRLTNSAGLDGRPSWNRDGTAIVYHSARTGRLQLRMREIGSARDVQLTRSDSPSRHPVWWQPPEVSP
jgi:TolB protein